MTRESLREYQLIREEMRGVKDCMTNYVGYMLGGSGAAIFGFTALSISGVGYIGLAYSALMMSLLVSMVLLVIFYKFHSHNRYAGYCKLLSFEKFEYLATVRPVQLFTWETCLEMLRGAETKPNTLYEIVDRFDFFDSIRVELIKKLNDYLGPRNGKNLPQSAPADERGFWRGFKRLFLALLGQSKTISWGFPPYVVAVFFVLCTGFLAVGVYSTLVGVFGDVSKELFSNTSHKYILEGVTLLILIMQAFLWRLFCRRLQSLMEGSATVEAFFWLFLPIRASLLFSQNIAPQYPDITPQKKNDGIDGSNYSLKTDLT